MKRGMMLLLAVLLACAGIACAETAMLPEQVTTMAEAETIIPLASVWAQPRPSYAQAHGFEAKAITPDAAYKALNRAYEQRGAAGYADLLRDWGFLETDGFGVPDGWPERRQLCEERFLCGQVVSLEAICFQGSYAEVSEYALIFMKREYGDWQLIDMAPGDAQGVRATSEETDALLFIELLTLGHGTGHYAEKISVYNPLTRHCDAAYTREGFECPLMDRNLYVSAWADYDHNGLRVVASSAFGSWAYAQDGRRLFTQRAQASDVYVYAIDTLSGSLVLRVHESHEGLAPSVLRASGIDKYLGGDTMYLH